MLGVPLALWLFFGGVHYTKLQFGTGIRYLSPTFPFLFVAATVVLARLPRPWAYVIGAISLAQSWCLAMYRDVERGWGMAEPILHVLTEGCSCPRSPFCRAWKSSMEITSYSGPPRSPFSS